jgi:hypothetical protein
MLQMNNLFQRGKVDEEMDWWQRKKTKKSWRGGDRCEKRIRWKDHEHNGNSRNYIMEAWRNGVHDEHTSSGWGLSSFGSLGYLFRIPMKKHSLPICSIWVVYCIKDAKTITSHSRVQSERKTAAYILEKKKVTISAFSRRGWGKI